MARARSVRPPTSNESCKPAPSYHSPEGHHSKPHMGTACAHLLLPSWYHTTRQPAHGRWLQESCCSC